MAEPPRAGRRSSRAAGAAASRSAFRPLRPPRNLTEELVARLTEEITSGALAPGQRLPTEQAMIAAFGVSRTVVRESIAALRAVGLVESRQGSGIFVSRDLHDRPFLIDPGGLRSLEQVVAVMEVRMSIEVEAAGLAAQRRSQDALAGIARAVADFDAAVQRGEAAVDEDFAFHCAIAEATGNPYFPRFLQFLGRYIIPRQSIRVGLWDEAGQRNYLQGVEAEHHAIAAAIEARDGEAAREATREHLRRGRERYRRIVAAAGEA